MSNFEWGDLSQFYAGVVDFIKTHDSAISGTKLGVMHVTTPDDTGCIIYDDQLADVVAVVWKQSGKVTLSKELERDTKTVNKVVLAVVSHRLHCDFQLGRQH